ncbi:MAG: hypothetical protein SFU98_02545 [Leptospiraceae bacterium]|nr:hypothetical protein [Leptospiraceae bacterium]
MKVAYHFFILGLLLGCKLVNVNPNLNNELQEIEKNKVFSIFDQIDKKWTNDIFDEQSNSEDFYYYILEHTYKLEKYRLGLLGYSYRAQDMIATQYCHNFSFIFPQFDYNKPLCRNNSYSRMSFQSYISQNTRDIACWDISTKDQIGKGYRKCKCLLSLYIKGGRDQALRDYAYIYGQCTKEEVCKIFNLDCDK